MARFVAFDVETPNRWNDRMSAIGITIVEDGEVVEEFYSLVDPEEPFDSFNVQLTGIDEQTVWGQPNFGELWPVIEPLMSSGMLLAHNLVSILQRPQPTQKRHGGEPFARGHLQCLDGEACAAGCRRHRRSLPQGVLRIPESP